jgi:hypothetical protein
VEAIFELLVACIIQPILLLFTLIQLLFSMLAMVLEFFFLAVTKGTRKARSTMVERRKTQSEQHQSKESKQALADRSPSARWSLLFVFLVFFGVIGVVAYQVVNYQIQRQRESTTESQIASVADATIAKGLPKEKFKNPRVLEDRDAWGKPLELFVDDFFLAKMVVIRSHGIDQRSGTIDDLLAIRWKRVDIPKVLGKVVDLGDKQFRNWLSKLLEDEKDGELPKRIDLK